MVDNIISKKMGIEMKKLSLIVVILLVLPIIFALEINIKTFPNHRISVIVRPAGELISIDSFHQDTGDGNVKLASSGSVNQVDLLITLKKDNVKMLDRRFEGVATNKPINIKFIPGETPEIIEESKEEKADGKNESEAGNEINLNNTEKIIENKELESLEESKEPVDKKVIKESVEEIPAVTGKTIEGLKKIVSSKVTYYIIGIMVIIGVLILVYFMRSRVPIGFKIRKLSSIKNYDSRLSDAEKKLDEAREELDEIKDKKKKLGEAREKFEKDRKELLKLEMD